MLTEKISQDYIFPAIFYQTPIETVSFLKECVKLSGSILVGSDSFLRCRSCEPSRFSPRRISFHCRSCLFDARNEPVRNQNKRDIYLPNMDRFRIIRWIRFVHNATLSRIAGDICHCNLSRQSRIFLRVW